MCGCKIAENSPWPPERYKVEAQIYKDGLFITAVDMPYAGEPGVYSVNIKIPLAGIYSVHVTAFDAQTKEAGMDTTTVTFKETEKKK